MTVTPIPVWKKTDSPMERLQELVEVARDKPEMFSKMVVVYAQEFPDRQIKIRYIAGPNTSTIEAMGLLTIAATELDRDTRL